MLDRAAAEQYYSYNASLRGALLLVEEALDILDLAEAPDEIASTSIWPAADLRPASTSRNRSTAVSITLH